MNFTHEQVCRVADLVGDPRALGGAVTSELCGHWEHPGPCRWPHHTATAVHGRDAVVTVRFTAPEAEVGQVRQRVQAAVSRGQLVGPDGSRTTWTSA
ncbi:hypothetical protein [Pedococcus sp. 5OH_020]|uniref:hypothetical protein n=1 Tax=Pedococcus sp. 5OH_020 TaxID=2989814 RepID=UPI0022E9DA04|nr:hypothetical protein [Pedococcus sp. 5OH_020]